MKEIRKKLTFCSGVLISFSMLGLTSLLFFDTKISQRRNEMTDLVFVQERVLKNLNDAKEKYDFARVLRNHIDILKELKAEDLAKKREKELLFSFQYTALSAINAAQLSRIINEKQAQEYINNSETFDSFDDFFNVYLNLFHKTSEGLNNLSRQIGDKNKAISTLEKWKKRILTISIIIQACGLLLGIISSSCLQNKNSNNK